MKNVSIKIATVVAISMLAACGGGEDVTSSTEHTKSLAPSASGTKLLATTAVVSPTITVTNQQIGTTADVYGYNIGHHMAGSNTKDWWRYEGIKAARVFVSTGIGAVSDGVSSQTSFVSRRNALRANTANPAIALSNAYVNWPTFEQGHDTVSGGNNRFVVSTAFPELRSLGVEILVNMTANPSTFPVSSNTDYAGMWKLWQHYYAQAFLLSRDYDVRRFSMFNEPNLFVGIDSSDWELRLRICSDAMQAGIGDMNARYGKHLIPQVFAANTANGSNHYNTDSSDNFGRTAVVNRHKTIFGTQDAAWNNFQVYNYQKYSMYPKGDASHLGYINDFEALRSAIKNDLGSDPMMPMALTEMNVRTGAQYNEDTTGWDQDDPADFVTLGANLVALSQGRLSQNYLFKFGMTKAVYDHNNYYTQKNATHYVDNETTGVNNYGGATATGETYRLFIKAAGNSRPRLSHATTLNSATTWTQVTRDATARVTYVFIANQGTAAVKADVNVASLNIGNGALATVEDVNQTVRGAVAKTVSVDAGMVATGDMPAQSNRLITIYERAVNPVKAISASADTALSDGAGKSTPGGNAAALIVRADETINGRKAAMIKFTVPTTWTDTQRVLLSLNVATTSGSTPIHTHVYGVTDNTWAESSATWATVGNILKQNIGGCKIIQCNVANHQGTVTKILGQLLVNSTTPSEKLIDVTDFVKSQSGAVSFLVLQDHRWDKPASERLSTSTRLTGDLQSAGIAISARQTPTPPTLKIYTAGTVPTVPSLPYITSQPSNQTVNAGAAVTLAVAASGSPTPTYQWKKAGVNIAGAISANHVIASATAGDTGAYSVVVTNSAGSVTSVTANLTVNSVTNSIISAEFENLTVAGLSTSVTSSIASETGYSSGAGVLFNASGTGQYIIFAVPVKNAGSYKIDLLVKTAPSRGMFQLSVSDSLSGTYTKIDGSNDEYSANYQYQVALPTFTQKAVFATGGNKYFKFTTTSKNSNSSDYDLSFDKITLTRLSN